MRVTCYLVSLVRCLNNVSPSPPPLLRRKGTCMQGMLAFAYPKRDADAAGSRGPQKIPTLTHSVIMTFVGVLIVWFQDWRTADLIKDRNELVGSAQPVLIALQGPLPQSSLPHLSMTPSSWQHLCWHVSRGCLPCRCRHSSAWRWGFSYKSWASRLRSSGGSLRASLPCTGCTT